MDLKQITKRGLLATAGYFLSPFSWWNDLYVNFPIAYGMAWAASLIDKRLFAFALVASYWLTNIAGLIMLHRGLTPLMAADPRPAKWYRNRIVTDLIVSVVYTGVISLLLYFGFLRLPQ
jgi:hypothetical protein